MTINSLEETILNAIIDYQLNSNGIDLRSQLEKLRVTKREFTGVGSFTHFDINRQLDLSDKVQGTLPGLGSEEHISVDELKYPLVHELSINDLGQFEMLEIVTIGESWNGKYKRIKK